MTVRCVMVLESKNGAGTVKNGQNRGYKKSLKHFANTSVGCGKRSFLMESDF